MINALSTLSANPFTAGPSATSPFTGAGPFTGTGPFAATGGVGGPSFSEALKNGIDQVAKLQQDAGQQVTDLATGRTENLSGVMTSVEKGDLAFKTLLAIRGKLMDAYEELRGMAI